jgi:hypothetical protein
MHMSPVRAVAVACDRSLALKDLRGFDDRIWYTYFLRPCGTLETVPRCVFNSVNASACLLDNQAPEGVGLGFFPPYGAAPKWGYIKDTQPGLGVYYDMVGQGGCGNYPYIASVVFHCASSSLGLSSALE